MKVTTKALASLVIVTMLTIASATTVAAADSSSGGKLEDKKLSRLVKRHDRKMELRASVLGISTDELKDELKTKNFEQIIKRHGFRDMKAFQTALAGKAKDELRRRGWSDQKIDNFITKRLDRIQKHYQTSD